MCEWPSVGDSAGMFPVSAARGGDENLAAMIL